MSHARNSEISWLWCSVSWSAKPHIVCSLVHISHTVTEVDDVFIRAQAILRRAALRDAASQLSRSAVTGFYKIPDPIQTATGGDFHSA